jgi:hypothetical protein
MQHGVVWQKFTVTVEKYRKNLLFSSECNLALHLPASTTSFLCASPDD